MNISTKGDYALRGLSELAFVYGNGKMLSIKKISEEENIPKRYLENIFLALKKSGIVDSIKGEKGGFRLTKAPGKIKILDVLNAVETKRAPSRCITNVESCEKAGSCGMRRVWMKMHENNNKFLERYTLKDISNRKQKKGYGNVK